MKTTCIVALTAFAAGTLAQTASDSFEAQDFNVTVALENLGVDVGTWPKSPSETTSPTGRRSSFAPCSLAVSVDLCKGVENL